MPSLLTALRFLTIIPLGKGGLVDSDRLASSMALFPLVGAIIGAGLWGLDRALSSVLPAGVVAALLVAALALVTGGLHLDGLSDTFDGFYGGRGDRERTLAIMKDSHAGAIGVVAVGLLLLVKYAAISSTHGPSRGPALILAPMLARWSQVQMSFKARSARGEGSLAKPFLDGLGPVGFIIAAVITATAVWLIGGMNGLVPLAAVIAFTLLARLFLNSKIGGITGDTIGAVNEINEALVLVVFSGII